MKNLRFVDLTEEEQAFLRERYEEYMKDEYEENWIGNAQGRDWASWAHDKAWDDALNMAEVKKSLEAI